MDNNFNCVGSFINKSANFPDNMGIKTSPYTHSPASTYANNHIQQPSSLWNCYNNQFSSSAAMDSSAFMASITNNYYYKHHINNYVPSSSSSQSHLNHYNYQPLTPPHQSDYNCNSINSNRKQVSIKSEENHYTLGKFFLFAPNGKYNIVETILKFGKEYIW